MYPPAPTTTQKLDDNAPKDGGNPIVRAIVWIAVTILGMLVLGYLAIHLLLFEFFHGPNRGDPSQLACRLARLAPIPGQVVWSENRQSPFSGSTYIVFRASRPEIEKWVADSPGMRGLSPTVFDANLRLEPPWDHQNNTMPPYDPHVERENVYTQEGKYVPTTKNGMRYKIPQDQDANYGTIIIDWDTGTVWIRASHS
jgi:hypothetical protein